jgi:hypothetical protein
VVKLVPARKVLQRKILGGSSIERSTHSGLPVALCNLGVAACANAAIDIVGRSKAKRGGLFAPAGTSSSENQPGDERDTGSLHEISKEVDNYRKLSIIVSETTWPDKKLVACLPSLREMLGCKLMFNE